MNAPKDDIQDLGAMPTKIPEMCPVCGHDIELLRVKWIHARNGNFYMCACPRKECRSIFVYALNNEGEIKSFPDSNLANDIPKSVLDYFPDFKKVYLQAKKAERINLDTVYGMAYRRSLEFLVKGYLFKFGIKTEEAAYNMSLSSAIKFLDNNDIKQLAKASSWLGNDQAHTNEKWPEYGVDDLKSFIVAFASFISFKINAQKANDLIQKRSKKPQA